MEDEVADGGVKRLVGIVQVCRIAFLKMDAGSDALDCRIFFALLFAYVDIIPHPPLKVAGKCLKRYKIIDKTVIKKPLSAWTYR